ncbi:DUF4604 domain-containing protein [Aspergillus stella-maris]|uniref:DUF4604 domain-containing protein n=1 Tax=Aspergillus stella-maris TaxID=1810926 RepID=UPI003CCE2EF2
MSYNAKNLAYDAKEPAFLQRLRGQYGGNATGGLERPISQRPRRARDDNEDDGPTYVDAESNEVISKEDYEAMVKGDGDEQSEQPDNGVKDKYKDAEKAGDSSKEGTASKQNLAEIGGPRKRKQAKVVGDEIQEAESEKSEEVRLKEAKQKKPKQKKKKIKLSFEE